jgi:uncharacterized iron-regulated membrane protein
MTNLMQGQVAREGSALQRYTAAWRWHFFAGVFVVPFLLVLATTGLVMLYYSTVQTPLGEHLLVTVGAGAPTSPVQQLATAHAALPGGTATLYVPASSPERTVQFELTQGERTYAVDIDPYTNEVLRLVDKDRTFYALAHRIHGTLLLGEVGDTIVEVVAGLALLMLATGVYMWFQQRKVAPATLASRRRGWRRWHMLTGLYAAVVLCFFLLSGLAWTNVWGGKWVQAWGTFPEEKWGPIPLSGETHGAMNHGAQKTVPWGLEQTPLPASVEESDHTAHERAAAVDLDSVEQRARASGFGPRYRINLPQDADGVYTISSTSMNGDTDRPADERTVHVDRRSGEIVAEVGFGDYSVLAKSMAVGIAAHQGSLGWWSIALDVLACTVVIFLCVSGTIMWWLRRPARAGWLPAPPRVAALPLRSGLTVLLLGLGVAFPLLGATLVVGLLAHALMARYQEQGR